MMEINISSNESDSGYYPITIVKKDSYLQPSSLPSQKSSLIKLAIKKDERLDYLNIPKGLIELLHINDFTIEKILDYGPSKIAEILGTDDYIAQIIFNETNNNKKS
ncbi:MAG TPA: hypothetical protein VFM28_08870 [Nitrososphaeraceae archaeon]|jgi:hypothetical protein|nr:hypothetical protein [Nitrososphaeraceae archaeon]